MIRPTRLVESCANEAKLSTPFLINCLFACFYCFVFFFYCGNVDPVAAMADGTEAAEAADPAAEEPVRAGARPAGRDVVDPVPKEWRNGAGQIAAQRGSERPESTVPRTGQIESPAQRVARGCRHGSTPKTARLEQEKHYIARPVLEKAGLPQQ